MIPGEVGTGPTGLSKTLPAALKQNHSVIVFGHGVFTKGKYDFNEALMNLVNTEQKCFDYFLSLISDRKY